MPILDDCFDYDEVLGFFKCKSCQILFVRREAYRHAHSGICPHNQPHDDADGHSDVVVRYKTKTSLGILCLMKDLLEVYTCMLSWNAAV